MESGVDYQDVKDDLPDDRITEYELPVIMNADKVENQISHIITQDKLARYTYVYFFYQWPDALAYMLDIRV